MKYRNAAAATARTLALAAAWMFASLTHADTDLMLADFEGQDYGTWKTDGEAFGTAPAQGTLANQMPVSGFEGHGLANSYLRGDAAVGTLTSPDFLVERKTINFLVGGGDHPDETCINLLCEGKVVRTTTGSDNEMLDWATWDVGALVGKTVRIEIVDRHQGGWGHINVDQIYQSDQRKAAVAEVVPLYHEALRPQFHFTAAKNWLNDPNGLVFYQGDYHLFFQHNPSGINWGNMTWGHAVSSDLLHWKQQDHALVPDKLGTIFSGSAVVDWQNTAGFQTGEEKAIVCIYTSAGGTSSESKDRPFTQSLAYSNDRGHSWHKYENNPVLGQQAPGNRDPKVFWHAASKQWVMALFLDGNRYALFGSGDLKQWKKLSDLPVVGDSECPDFFELPIDGEAGGSKWVFWGGNNNYLLGSFDGTTFTKEAGPHRFEFGNNYYAAQTYSDIPAADGRRIQIAWMSGGKYPKMPFNQQMSIPSQFVLKRLPDGVRLCRQPVKELDALRGAHHSWQGTPSAGENPLAAVAGELFDISVVLSPSDVGELVLTLRGAALRYDAQSKQLSLLGKTASLGPGEGKTKLRILVDRSSIEVFAGEGQVTMSSCFVPSANDKSLQLSGNGVTVEALDVWELKSCWSE